METKLFFKKAAAALVALAAMMPATMAAYDFNEGGIYYDVNGNEVTVTRAGENVASYTGDVVIPETVVHNGVEYAVTAIGYSAFSYCYGLTSIEIPNTIVSIGDHAFLHCESLQHVVVPNSVIDMGRCAFHWCTNLKTAVIGNSVQLIHDYAFQYCYQLTDVVIGSSVRQLNIKAFYDCYSLANITCMAPEPPAMYAWYSFYDTNYGNATLYVPGGSMEAYKTHEIWGMFNKIASLTLATGLTLDQSFVTLNGGEQVQLHATVEPADAGSAVNWTSSDEAVAIVSANGLVTAVGPGEAVITAATVDGTELTAQCVVRVYSTSVQDDNVLTMPAILNAEGGMSCELPVAMRNVAGISALQCDIILPEGIALAQEDGNYLVDVSSERLAPSHAVSIRQLSSGAVRMLITSTIAEPFSGNDGDLFVLHLDVTPGLEDGTYPVQLTNVVMADVNALTYHAPDVATTVIIKNAIKGDANGDGLVNVGDYVTTANYIMELNPVPFVFAAADVDENETIDVGDLVGITNIIMGEYQETVEPEPEREVMLAGSCVNDATGTCIMTLDLTNDVDITALQMDVTLPDGMSLQRAELTSRAADHNLVVNTSDNGRVKLLASSLVNADLQGNEGALLTITLVNNGSGSGDVAFDNIVLAERDMTTHRVGAFKVNAQGSGVREITSDVRIYAQGGNIIVETPVETTVEIIMTNGMSRTVKAQAGMNAYRASQGIHIVRAAGQVAKLKI